MIRALSILLFCFPATLLAQFNYKLSSEVSVEQEDLTLNIPWAGGLNAPQFNTMDVNNDGLDDLILYDRTSSLVLPYLQQDGKYIYAPDYAVYFSVEIENWLVLRDYNCDGVKDLFTGDALGIKVYTNQAEAGEAPIWDQFIFYTDKGKSNVLLSKGAAFKNNVPMQYDDLPAFVDADADGDLDFYSMIYSTGSTIEFHKNFSMERYGVCDSLDFERQTQKWGGVTECVCGTFAFNNAACPTGGRTLHAGGKSLTAIDADGNGLMDLLISEANCNRVFLLRNEGDFENPIVTEATVFPAENSVNILPYPSAYYEDVDFDGVKDLVASPNIYSRSYLETDLENSVWFYKNTGTTAAPVFSFVQRDFLQENMIDAGDNAVPILIDLDIDGDTDLLISRNTSNLNVATVLLYENVGDHKEPVFKLANEDFLNFSAYTFYNLKAHLADMNSDGRTDFVFTASSIFNGVVSLYYIPNTETNGYSWSLTNRQTIVVPLLLLGTSENIYAVDIDRDGKTDLLQGKSNGSLYYWRNTGALNFELASEAYLGLASSVLRQSITCTSADLNADGKSDLIIGDQMGRLLIINNFYEAVSYTEGTTNVVWNNLTETYETRNLGGRVWTAVGNLFNVKQPSLLIGNTMGGVVLLRPDEEGVLPEVPVIHIYPNPTVRTLPLTVKTDRVMKMELFSSLGKILLEPITIQSYQPYMLNTNNLAAGLYLLRFTVNNQRYIKRFVVE